MATRTGGAPVDPADRRLVLVDVRPSACCVAARTGAELLVVGSEEVAS
jgi:hypothetical protein